EARISARFHHACTDGVGAAQWLDDVMVRYAQLNGDEKYAPEHNEIDVRRLVDRGRDRRPIPFGLRRVGQSIRNIYTHLCQLPRPLATPPPGSAKQDPLHSLAHQFSAEDTAIF